jgi:ubiquinone/menaquinone biosynthesis C-methylase UbiE
MDRLLELTYLAEQSHFWFRGFRSFMQPEVARAVEGRRAPVLIDCGCGTGANVSWLQRYGTTYGFDLTWNGLALGHQRERTRLARATIGAIPFPDACADVATSFDVFQCLPDAVERDAIREMWRILKPGGHLVMNVAALHVLRGHHAAMSQEVRRYTPARLRQLVEGAGFQINRLTFVHATLFPLMLTVRIAQRLTSGGKEVPPGEFEITVPPAPINGLLSAALRLEALALKVVNMPIGSSLMVHAVKPAHATSANHTPHTKVTKVHEVHAQHEQREGSPVT